MSSKPWDWSFASFGSPPSFDDEGAPHGLDTTDEEPTPPARPSALSSSSQASQSQSPAQTADDELARHMWRLRMARTPEERRRAARAALAFLEESRRVAAQARRRAAEDEPTLVDERVPAELFHPSLFESSTSADTSIS